MHNRGQGPLEYSISRSVPVNSLPVERCVSADDFRWWFTRLGRRCVAMTFETTSILTLSSVAFTQLVFLRTTVLPVQ